MPGSTIVPDRKGATHVFTKAFRTEDGTPARTALFDVDGGTGIASHVWLHHALTMAQGFGLFDLPVVENDQGSLFEYRISFNTITDLCRFQLAVEGVQHKPGGFSARHRLDDHEPDALCDAWLEAIERFCARHVINCALKKIDARTFQAMFDTNVGLSAFYHGFQENGPIHRLAMDLSVGEAARSDRKAHPAPRAG